MFGKGEKSQILKLVCGLAVASLTLGATSVQALEIAPPKNFIIIGTADVGKSFDVNWSLNIGANNPTLSASSVWTILGFDSQHLTLQLSLTNTTADTGTFHSAITSFGAGVTPNATGSFAPGGQGSVFKQVSHGNGPQQTFPGGFKSVDLCVSSSGCSGGSFQLGLHAGVTDIMTIVLTAAFGSTPEVSLAFFPVKFQTSAGSFEPAGQVSTVPLPMTLPLLATGLVGLLGLGRRRKSATPCH